MIAGLAGCGERADHSTTSATEVQDEFRDMPYERDDPRAQAPAEFLRWGQARSARPLSATLPDGEGAAGPAVLPVPPGEDAGTVRDFAIRYRPGLPPEVLEPSPEAKAAGEEGRFDGGTPTFGSLDGVRPASERAGSVGETGERSAPVIYNADGRTRVPLFSSGAAMAVKVFAIHVDGARTACSGTIVNDRFVLTAGHCIKNYQDGHGWATAITVVPGMDGSYMPYGSFTADSWTTSGAWDLSPDRRFDWGLIRIPTRIGAALGNGALHAAAEADLSVTEYRSWGYPGMLAGTPNSASVPDPRRGSFLWESYDSRGLQVPSFGPCSELGGGHNPYHLCTFADMSPGQSGSGAWLTNLFGREVYAIYTNEQTYHWTLDLEPDNVHMRIRGDNVTSMVTWMQSQPPHSQSVLVPTYFKVLPNDSATDPLVVADSGDNMTVLSLRADGSLWTRARARVSSTSGVWSSDWVSAGGTFTTPIAAVSEASGRI